MRDYRLYLRDTLAAIESIEMFVEGMDLKALLGTTRPRPISPSSTAVPDAS